MTLEHQIDELVKEFDKSNNIVTQRNLYNRLVKLSFIFIREFYPDLPKDGVESISHEVASDLICRLIKSNNPVYNWGKFTREITRRTAADWMRANLYNINQPVEDIELFGLSLVDGPNRLFSDSLAETVQSIQICFCNIKRILDSCGIMGTRGMLAKKLIVEEAIGNSYLYYVPRRYHPKIKLLSYLIRCEVYKLVIRVTSQS